MPVKVRSLSVETSVVLYFIEKHGYDKLIFAKQSNNALGPYYMEASYPG